MTVISNDKEMLMSCAAALSEASEYLHKPLSTKCYMLANELMAYTVSKDSNPEPTVIHEDTTRLNWMQANLLKHTKTTDQDNNKVEVNMWGIASATHTNLREVIDMVRRLQKEHKL